MICCCIILEKVHLHLANDSISLKQYQSIFSRVHATLQPALSVCWLVTLCFFGVYGRFWHCVPRMCPDIVSRECVLTLCPYIVSLHCVPKLCPDIMSRHCFPTLFPDIVSRHCFLTLCPNIVSQHCVPTLCPNIVSQHCVPTLSRVSRVWHATYSYRCWPCFFHQSSCWINFIFWYKTGVVELVL